MSKITDKTLNVALIGYGYAGKTFHAPLITGTPGLKLTTIVSSDQAKVHHDYPDLRVEQDAEEIFKDPSVQLVVVATPNDTHFDLAKRALESGKNVVVDKPFATTSYEAWQLFTLAKESDRLVSVFQNRRWDSDFLAVQKVLNTRILGEISCFQSSFNRYRPHVQARWREQASTGGGLWFDLGPHLVDQAMMLFGIPDTVYGDLSAQRSGAQSVDYFHVVLAYGKSRVILHASSLVLGDTPRFAIHGTEGSYIKHGLDTQEESLKQGRKPGGTAWGHDPLMGVIYLPGQSNVSSKNQPNPPGDYLAYYKAIHNAVALNSPNPIDAEQAISVMRILELAMDSANYGRTLAYSLKLPDESPSATGVLDGTHP